MNDQKEVGAQSATEDVAAGSSAPDAASHADRIYPCADCGVMRTKAEGGTTFTVCDACWDKAYAKAEGR